VRFLLSLLRMCSGRSRSVLVEPSTRASAFETPNPNLCAATESGSCVALLGGSGIDDGWRSFRRAGRRSRSRAI
jgi:hypothetical protein